MIDLRIQSLPTAIEVDGRAWELNTNFRVWIAFDAILRDKGGCASFVFKGYDDPDFEPPSGDWATPSVEFLECRDELPRDRGRASARLVDYVKDGTYIVAAFQQAYGIDLTDPTLYLHWHRFLALFRGLPENTMMSRIMGYRGWRKDNRKSDAVMSELRDAWRLPEPGEDEQRAALLKWAEDTIG